MSGGDLVFFLTFFWEETRRLGWVASMQFFCGKGGGGLVGQSVWLRFLSLRPENRRWDVSPPGRIFLLADTFPRHSGSPDGGKDLCSQ